MPQYTSAPSTEVVTDITWFIDVGPFFDRFGASKIAVLASSDPVVKACVSDVQSRKWVDLKRGDLSQAIDLIIAANIPGVNSTLKNSILNTLVAPAEQLALKKLYFS
jgi:hypothetical protein